MRPAQPLAAVRPEMSWRQRSRLRRKPGRSGCRPARRGKAREYLVGSYSNHTASQGHTIAAGAALLALADAGKLRELACVRPRSSHIQRSSSFAVSLGSTDTKSTVRLRALKVRGGRGGSMRCCRCVSSHSSKASFASCSMASPGGAKSGSPGTTGKPPGDSCLPWSRLPGSACQQPMFPKNEAPIALRSIREIRGLFETTCTPTAPRTRSTVHNHCLSLWNHWVLTQCGTSKDHTT
jgi:hypothetical protein